MKLGIFFRKFKRWIKTLLGLGTKDGKNSIETFAVLFTKNNRCAKWIPNPKNAEEAKEILDCKRVFLVDIEMKPCRLDAVLIYDPDEEDDNSIFPNPLVVDSNNNPICKKSKCLICNLIRNEKTAFSNNLGSYGPLKVRRIFTRIPEIE